MNKLDLTKQRFKMGRTVMAVLLCMGASLAQANSYFVVVPTPGKTSVSAPSINVSLAGYTLPGGMSGQPYAGFDFRTLLSVTGDPTFTGIGVRWRVVSGSLPAGLTLNADGTLSGTPTAGGTSSFQVMASYKTKAGQQAYQVQVATITVGLGTGTPPQALVGQAYSYDLKPMLSVSGDPAFNGSGVTWSVASSSLPAGLFLTSDGFIAGTPTAAGNGAITARASYRGASGQQTYQVVSLAITVSLNPATLPQAIVGQAYSYDLKPMLSVSGDPAFNGSGVTWSVVSGSLPAGLSLTSDGVIGGTPTAAGNVAIIARASYRGVNGQQTYQVVSLHITVSLNPATLPQAIVGQAYSQDLKSMLSVSGDPAFNGSGVTWSVVSGSLPAGLSLTSNGVIGGAPTAAGNGAIIARASYRGVNGQQTYQVASIAISVVLDNDNETLDEGAGLNLDLRNTLHIQDPASNGTVAVWAVTSGNVPPGLVLGANGVLSGVPSQNGNFTFVATVTYRGVRASATYSFLVD
jgi:hypothetical protein